MTYAIVIENAGPNCSAYVPDLPGCVAAGANDGMSTRRSRKTIVKAVFFDYDGVLTTDKTGSLTINRFLSRRTSIPYESLVAAFRKHNGDLNAGMATYADIWPAVCTSLGRELPQELLVAAFESTPLNDEMLRLARNLKARYAVGIITDNKKDRIDHLRKYQALDEVFAPIVVSAEIGHTKASPVIFEHALAGLGLSPHECVFIDNTPSNLVVATKLGMGTVHFDDETNDVPNLVARLRSEYGISVESPDFSIGG
jgi:putative hydrolase of the HAD superfamily